MRGEIYDPEGETVWAATGRLYCGQNGNLPTTDEALALGRNIADVILTSVGERIHTLMTDG